MKPATVPLLRCVAPRLTKATSSQRGYPAPSTALCGGKLSFRLTRSKRQTLECTRCAAVYRTVAGISAVIPPHLGEDEGAKPSKLSEHYG